MVSPDAAPFVESANKRRGLIARAADVFAAAKTTDLTRLIYNDGIRWIRPLFESEIATLEGQICRCQCRDWSKIRLLLSSSSESTEDQSHVLVNLVRDNTFEGVVVLGIPSSGGSVTTSKKVTDGLPPTGVFGNGLISNCILEPDCRVHRNMMLQNTYVCNNALVLKCGSVSTAGEKTGYGAMEVTVGPESGGGRKILLTAESTMIDVCQSLTKNVPQSTLADKAFVGDFNIIGPNAILRDTATIEHVYLDSHACISGAASVKNAALLPNARIDNSSIASNVLLQWNASITDQSNVSDTLLMEHAHAGPQSVCASSVLGPDVHVSCGEVHASVLGPNANAHHQSLVISVLWPLGRGNVGYGANVGSNHTGRLPDQESCAGEGTFWGLSTVIKFPVNLLHSPYSIVAAGTTMVPQRVAMPFSLIVDGNESGGLSQIIPAWVLQNSPYTLTRSELKFATRRKARRHLFYTGWSIIRPDVIDMCIAARDALQSVQQKDIYKTEREVMGIGKSYLTEQARQAGIEAYSACIQRYALSGLLEKLQEFRHKSGGKDGVSALLNMETRSSAVPLPTADSTKAVAWPILPWNANSSCTWRHQWSVLQQEFPMKNTGCSAIWLQQCLHELVKLEKDHAHRVFQCKKRDDVRGAKTIPGCASAHVSAEKDATIVHVQEEARKVEQIAETLVAELHLENTTRSRL